MNYNWTTGEPMVPPSERDYPSAAATNAMADKSLVVNYPFHQKCQNMETAELESLVREAQNELNRRRNERINKIIDKVCVELNELRHLGVEFIVHDCDGYDFYVFGADEFIDKNNFKIPEDK